MNDNSSLYKTGIIMSLIFSVVISLILSFVITDSNLLNESINYLGLSIILFCLIFTVLLIYTIGFIIFTNKKN